MSTLPLTLAQSTPGLATWFAVLGGAAGFVSLYLTLKRGRTIVQVPAPAPVAVPVATAAAPAPAPKPAPVAPVVTPPADDSIPAEIMALIAAAVAVTVGPNARIAAVHPTAPSLDVLQQWSVEGRRQIYSSHQIR